MEEFIAIEKEGRIHRAALCPLARKVKPVASTMNVLGEKYMYSLSNDRTTCFVNMDEERTRPIVSGYLSAKSLEPTYADSRACSFGDCSVTNSSYSESSYHSCSLKKYKRVIVLRLNTFVIWDVRSFVFSQNKAELAGKIHRSGLLAFCRTIQALHVSGLFSWERESLVTNLQCHFIFQMTSI